MENKNFIDDGVIENLITNTKASKSEVRDIIAKAKSIETLAPQETAALLNTTDRELIEEIEAAADIIKKKVYDNRIVTFAPLYLSTLCSNDCYYCGLRSSNTAIKRGVLTLDEVRDEIEVLAGQIGHKRLVVVYGEHPTSNIDYMTQTIEAIYNTQVTIRNKPQYTTSIRRVNVNAAPMTVDELKILHAAGIGTYQVFQETYHEQTYKKLHPQNTPKGDFLNRLYCMHRALEAGVNDVGIGALFGLYDWKFEVMGLLYHALELEEKFGVGPHTISFPRLEPAENTPFATASKYAVSDEDFRKAVAVLRLSVPYCGMILTARENAALRTSFMRLGITQTDASSNIGLGAYNKAKGAAYQEANRQQFILGDMRSLDDVVKEYARSGCITSFCTAGYRCGRTGECIMDSLRTGAEGKLCKLNAIITYREWLDDFASDETRELGEVVLRDELNEVYTQNQYPQKLVETFRDYYDRTEKGERDLYF